MLDRLEGSDGLSECVPVVHIVDCQFHGLPCRALHLRNHQNGCMVLQIIHDHGTPTWMSQHLGCRHPYVVKCDHALVVLGHGMESLDGDALAAGINKDDRSYITSRVIVKPDGN